jgi:fructose-1,6-bisphosphatase II / sedoheptulose-1,7-bisphosphatase
MYILKAHYLQHAKTITKAATLACFSHIGMGDEQAADQAAVSAMRHVLGGMDFRSHVVIGEGERDRAPMLYAGEVLGEGTEEVDIAVDPLEGTTLCANAMPDSISVLAMAPRGGLLKAPDVYMHKIAVGSDVPTGTVSLKYSLTENLRRLADAQNKSVAELTVCILKRPRHEEWVHEAHSAQAKVKLITDGDVMAALMTSMGDFGIDMYYGIGGAPEGVLAAAGLSCLKGYIEGKLIARNETELQRLKQMGIENLERIYTIKDMVKSDVIFCASGVTNGTVLDGAQIEDGKILTHHLLMHKATNTMSFISDVEV